MSKIFISYSRLDSPFALKLAESLSEAGAEIWIDVQDIPPGMKWSTAIQQGLESCEVMLVVVSPESMGSTNVEDEWQYFIDLGKKVIPLKWRSAKMHFQLNRLQYVDFHSQDYDAALQQLFVALNIRPTFVSDAEKRAYDLLIRQNEDWTAFGKRDSQLLNPDAVDIVLGSVRPVLLPQEAGVYLLWSIAHLGLSAYLENVRSPLRDWAGSIEKDTLRSYFRQALQHPTPELRAGIVNLMRRLELSDLADCILDLLENERESPVKIAALGALDAFGIRLPGEVAQLLLKDDDWLVKTYALRDDKPQKASLLISDGTEFAEAFEELLQEAGYFVVKLSQSGGFWDWEIRQHEINGSMFKVYDLILMVRGEHFSQEGNENFYDLLKDYVLSGGTLFATAWVGWETQRNPSFAEILPFMYRQFVEDVRLWCRPTKKHLAQELFGETIAYLAAYERSIPRQDAVVLLEAQDGIPVFGYRYAGSGTCYYFNSCQHSCTSHPPSPFVSSSELRKSMQRILKWIYESAGETDASS